MVKINTPAGTIFNAALILVLLGALSSEAAAQPNFVFFLVDDLHVQGTGATGHPYAQTPNIDRVANEGLRFNNAFVTTSLCAPSRASFLCGKYGRTHGVWHNRNLDLDTTKHKTFAQYFQEVGYQTAFVGKWHQKSVNDPRPGFNLWASFSGQGYYFGTPSTPITIRYYDGIIDRTDQYTNNEYNTDLLTDYAEDWLDSLDDGGPPPPFCLCLWYKAVHAPDEPATRHANLYSGMSFQPLPPNTTNPDPAGKPEYVANIITGWNSNSQTSKQQIVDSIALKDQRTLAAVEESVGQILSVLTNMGVLDETVVVFTSDNGFFFREFGLGDKRLQYEPSIRIPWFIRYPPMITAGQTSDLAIINIDLAPTFLDLAGVAVPADMEGRSFKGILDGTITTRSQWRSSWFTEYLHDTPHPTPICESASLYLGTNIYKFTRYPWKILEDELYNLTADQYEMTNQIDNAVYAAQLEDTKQERSRLVTVATGPEPNPLFFDCYFSDTAGTQNDMRRGLDLLGVIDGENKPVETMGRMARQTINGDCYMYFNVLDDWAYDGNRPVVDVIVTYLDSGTGTLQLHYDSTDIYDPIQQGTYKQSSSVALGNTGQWLSHTFELFDARFANRQSEGADFRIVTETGNTITVDIVELTSAKPGLVQINLGENDIYEGLFRVVLDDANTIPDNVGERDCLRTENAADDKYIYFDVSDEFAFAGSRPDLFITIEYYNEGTDPLTLQYDSTNGAYTDGDSVALTGSDTWLQRTFHVTDAYFGNRQTNGADFRIHRAAGFIYLDKVRITVMPSPASNPTPADLETDISINAHMSFKPGEGATSYKIYFGKTNPPQYHSTQSETYFNPAGMKTLSTYFWKVDAMNDNGNASGQVWRFTTGLHPADFDCDDDVDQNDFGYLQACFSGTGINCDEGCKNADFDGDNDVDQQDLDYFLSCMSGENHPPDC